MSKVSKYVASKRDFINAFKLKQGCADCGYKEHVEALDFDHRPGVKKVGNIATLKLQAGWAALLEEIDKCDVVCANCHRVRTANRRGMM